MSKVNAAYATEEAQDEVGNVNVPSRWAQARLVYQIDSPTHVARPRCCRDSPVQRHFSRRLAPSNAALLALHALDLMLFFCAGGIHRHSGWSHHSTVRSTTQRPTKATRTRLVAKMHILVANMFIILITVYVVYVSFLHYSNVILVSCLFSLFSHMRGCMRILKMYIDMCLRTHTHTYNCRAHQPVAKRITLVWGAFENLVVPRRKMCLKKVTPVATK